MKAKQSEINERTESFLDERWIIANMKDARPQDISYYNGALECGGYEWKRDEYGKHRVWKSH